MKNYQHLDGGITMLITVLAVSVIALGVAVSVSLRSIDSTKGLVGDRIGQQALKIAEGCTEEAQLRIKRNQSYTGGNLNVGTGSCIIAVTSNLATVPNTYTATIDASMMIGGNTYTKRVVANLEGEGNSLTIISWGEQ